MNVQQLNPQVKFIDPSELLIESIEPEVNQVKSQVLTESELNSVFHPDYNGYDLNFDEEVKQNDFHIGTGIYFDVDKKGEDSCDEEEPEKKKLWFLPFSVNQTLKVDSNLVLSEPQTGGLFRYDPVSGEVPGTLFEEKEEEEVKEKGEGKGRQKGRDKQKQGLGNYSGFQQFDDEENHSSGGSIKKLTCWLLICGLIYNVYNLN